MGSNLNVICSECGHKITTSYIMLGAESICPACNKNVRLEPFDGMVYPSTGYEITFGDFKQLLHLPNYQPAFRKFLSEALGLKIEKQNDTFAICSAIGEALDLLALHLRIQDDPPLQLQLYRLAMSLWR